ncbi:MAG: hypothetical protein A4E61_00245 [Syntrophorhabdus sp. PtaB.Bin184]|nr:MAG: hypothetical protein A4E61_00245 [Syntrophorhabdus sp. PtaB.Bin184]
MCMNSEPAGQDEKSCGEDEKKVWIVVTVIEFPGDDDLYGDVVGVFRKEQTAKDLRDELIANHRYDLVEYDHAAYFSRELDVPVRPEEDGDEEEP